MGNIKHKKTILIDLDGVLNTYQGNFREEYIEPLRNGAAEFLKKLDEKYNVKVFTARKKILANKWLIHNNIAGFIKDITNFKEPAFLYIDDRAICFQGNYGLLESKIENFKPFWQNRVL